MEGLLLAGVYFILPTVFIIAAFAWAYGRYGTLPWVQPFIYGIKPAIIGIVSMMITLGKKALKIILLGMLGAVAIVLAFIGFGEVYILFSLGFAGTLFYAATQNTQTLKSFAPPTLLTVAGLNADSFNRKIFWIFLKVGSI